MNFSKSQNLILTFFKEYKTRCRPSKRRRCIPDVDIAIGETYLNVDFSLSAQVKFNFKLWKKKSNFWFPCCSTRRPFRWKSITNVGLILTKPGRFLFSAYGNSGYRQNSISSISNFLKKIHIFGFPWWSTREDHSIDVSITNVGLILTKLRWFQLIVKSQNSNFFEKIKFLGFHGVAATREDLSIDVSITNVGLILTKLWWFQLFVKSQNSNFELFWKKNSNFGVPMV